MKTINFLVLLLGLSLSVNSYAKETRTKIAIIDTGIALNHVTQPYICTEGNLDLTGYGLIDHHGHGTNVAGIIAKRIDPKKYCLQIIKWFDHAIVMKNNRKYTIWINLTFSNALKQALNFNAKYVNMSLAGNTQSEMEKNLLGRLLDSGALVAVAAGNNSQDLDKDCGIYPACYDMNNPNFVVVGNKDNSRSNTGRFLVMEDGNNIEGFGITMTGSSQATAVYLSKRIK